MVISKITLSPILTRYFPYIYAMKSLMLFLVFIPVLLHAQMTSGTIVYQVNYDYLLESVEDDTDPSFFTIEFNEHYRKSYASAEWMQEEYITISDLTTKTDYFYNLNKTEKSMHCIDLSPLPEEETNSWMDGEEEWIEEPEDTPEIDLSKDFYKQLLAMPSKNDTVVYHSKETKDILGYTCKKVVLKIGKETTNVYWVTDEISGSEDLGSLSAYFSGTILQMSSDNGMSHYAYEATEIRNTSKLKEKELPELPNGYHLYLGVFYAADRFGLGGDTPNYIDLGKHFKENRSTVLKIYRAIYDIPAESYETFTVEVNEKGVVTAINMNSSSTQLYADDHTAKLLKKVQKKVVFEPVLLSGKAVPFRMDLSNW